MEVRQLTTTEKQKINKDDLSWILHTSIEDAKYRIRKTNLLTLQEALRQEKAGYKPRTSLVKMLESRIRQLQRTGGASN